MNLFWKSANFHSPEYYVVKYTGSVLCLFPGLITVIESGKHEKRLLEQIRKNISGFNIYERPAEIDETPLKVEMGLTLQQIIDVVGVFLFDIKQSIVCHHLFRMSL